MRLQGRGERVGGGKCGGRRQAAGAAGAHAWAQERWHARGDIGTAGNAKAGLPRQEAAGFRKRAQQRRAARTLPPSGWTDRECAHRVICPRLQLLALCKWRSSPVRPLPPRWAGTQSIVGTGSAIQRLEARLAALAFRIGQQATHSLPPSKHSPIGARSDQIATSQGDQALAQGRRAPSKRSMLQTGPLAARQALAPLAHGGLAGVGPLAPLPARQPAGSTRLRRARRAAGCRPSRRPLPPAAALQREGESLALPLNYFKLLGVSGVCSRDTLARALEK